MQFDRIAFAHGSFAILIRQGQNAVFIGVRAQVFDGIGLKPETIGTICVEGHFRTAVVGCNHDQLGRRCFCGGSFCRCKAQHVCRNRVVAGQLFTVGIRVMELDRIAFAHGRLAVLVRQGQNTVFIGVGAHVFNGIRFKPETVSAVRIEGHFRAAVVGCNHNRFGRRCFCGGSFCRCKVQHVCRNRVVAGQLITIGIRVMELDRIAFAHRRLAVLVRQGQDALLIGIGALFADAVCSEIKLISTVCRQRHGRAAVIGGNHSRRSGGFCRCFRCCRLFHCFFGGHNLIARDGASAQRPHRFRNCVQNSRIIRGIIGAVRNLCITQLVLCR